jgi:hypothetical protein
MAWVPAKEVIRKAAFFLEKFKASETELKDKQAKVNELSPKGLYSFLSRNWIWRFEREVAAINSLAQMSIDGRILISVADLNLLNRATPQAVEDALRDLDAQIVRRQQAKAEAVEEDCQQEVSSRYQRARIMTFAGVVILVAAIVTAISKGVLQ